jgi:hypothetical protein
MASRWFVFWMSLFVIDIVREDGAAWLWLVFAVVCSDPLEEMQRKQYQDTKRIVKQYFERYFGDKGEA